MLRNLGSRSGLPSIIGQFDSRHARKMSYPRSQSGFPSRIGCFDGRHVMKMFHYTAEPWVSKRVPKHNTTVACVCV